MVSRALGGVLAALALLSLSVYGCGPTVPKHNGYRSSKPWKKAKRVKFDEENEISIDGSVSYIKKRRARWYVVELPGDGELTAKMEVQPTEIGAAGAEMALGFEVLDAGYNVVLRRYPDPKDSSAKSSKKKKKRAKSADDDDDDDDDEWTGDDDDDDDDDEAEGELEWEQTLLELHAGRYFVHVYALARLDAADFSLRLKYTPGTAKRRSTFPADVPFYDPLPVVPAFDDAPSVDCSVCDCRRDKECKSGCGKCQRRTSHHRTKVTCSTCSCSSRSCARGCKQKCGSSSTSAVGSVKARVVGIIASGTGTKITLNRGSSQGVQVGWRGKIVNGSGKSIEKGSFTVTKVTGRSSQGKVGASQDSVRAAGRAVLRAP